MNKYIIEGDIDFYEELYKLLDNEEDNEEDNDLCLITNKQLTDNFITLDCGHKFNYIPLFYDIKNHKQKFNRMEGNSTRLNNNEIRCPYCRNKHIGTLPYHEEFGFEKINGVNISIPYVNNLCCQYEIPNENYNESIPESNVNKKNTQCACYYSKKISIYNKSNPGLPITYGDDKYYCFKHKQDMIKKYKQQIKDKAKEDLKKSKEKIKKAKLEEKQKVKEEIKKAKLEEKQKAKEEIKKAKLQEKQKAKEDIKKAKLEEKQNTHENVLVLCNNGNIL
jgi:hypothetical protein